MWPLLKRLSRSKPAGVEPCAEGACDEPRVREAARSGSAGREGQGGALAAARWMFLLVMVYAPWAYGCTRLWTIDVLNIVLFGVLSLWVFGLGVARVRPQVPALVWIAVGWLLVQGWWMTLNAGFYYDHAYGAHRRAALASGWPGAVDYAAAQPTMVTLTAILGAVCLGCDLAASRRWRRRLVVTMVVAGVSIIVLGLAQKISRAPGIFWQAEGHAPTFFGPFRYHANAGSFINLVWPLAAALLARSIEREDHWRVRLGWSLCLILALGGALANTSRASGLITVVWVVGWGGWLGVRLLGRRGGVVDPTAVAGVALALAAVVIGLLAAGSLDSTMGRWQAFDREMTTQNSRLMVAQVCVGMLPKSGWFGFGPGTFKTAFPFFNQDKSAATEGIWEFAHQDYLQTLVEWGWVGGAGWALLIGGGLTLAIWRLVRRRITEHSRPLALAAVAAMTAVLVHAFVDFPLQIASIQLYFSVLLGLLWSSGKWGDVGGAEGVEERPKQRVRRRHRPRHRHRRAQRPAAQVPEEELSA